MAAFLRHLQLARSGGFRTDRPHHHHHRVVRDTGPDAPGGAPPPTAKARAELLHGGWNIKRPRTTCPHSQPRLETEGRGMPGEGRDPRPANSRPPGKPRPLPRVHPPRTIHSSSSSSCMPPHQMQATSLAKGAQRQRLRDAYAPPSVQGACSHVVVGAGAAKATSAGMRKDAQYMRLLGATSRTLWM